jgi:predicted RNA-binding protein with PUA-like domain
LTPPARERKPASKAAKRPRSEAKPSEAQQNWLVKSDPESYGWDELVKEGGTRWDGVRNAEARNSLAAMRPGELALFYHSGADKAVVGIAKVESAAYPEPGADDPRWLAVDLAPLGKLARPVTLAEIKAERSLAKLKLVTHSRLSVMPVDAPAFERILALARSQPKR